MACCRVNFTFFTSRPQIVTEDQKYDWDHTAKLPATFLYEHHKYYIKFVGSNWDQTTD